MSQINSVPYTGECRQLGLIIAGTSGKNYGLNETILRFGSSACGCLCFNLSFAVDRMHIAGARLGQGH